MYVKKIFSEHGNWMPLAACHYSFSSIFGSDKFKYTQQDHNCTIYHKQAEWAHYRTPFCRMKNAVFNAITQPVTTVKREKHKNVLFWVFNFTVKPIDLIIHFCSLAEFLSHSDCYLLGNNWKLWDGGWNYIFPRREFKFAQIVWLKNMIGN